MLNEYFDDNQLDSLKNVGLASLIAGGSLAGIKHLINSGSSSYSQPFTLGTPGASTVEVPVPGQEALPGASDLAEKRQIRKSKGKGKKFKPFNPGKNVAIDESEKQSEFKSSDLTNPYYAPALLAAAGIPMIGGYSLLNHVFKEKKKKDVADELEDAKREFGEALVEAHSNRLPEPISISSKPESMALAGLKSLGGNAASGLKSLGNNALDYYKGLGHKKAASEHSSLFSDLDKLAEVTLREPLSKAAADGDGKSNLGPALTNTWNSIVNGAVAPSLKGLSDFGGYLYDKAMPYVKGYTGLAGALALGAGALGTSTGYSYAKNNDQEELDHQMYLNEFLTRRQAEGMPIYSVPVPVKINKKKNTLTPKSDVTEQLSEEA